MKSIHGRDNLPFGYRRLASSWPAAGDMGQNTGEVAGTRDRTQKPPARKGSCRPSPRRNRACVRVMRVRSECVIRTIYNSQPPRYGDKIRTREDIGVRGNRDKEMPGEREWARRAVALDGTAHDTATFQEDLQNVGQAREMEGSLAIVVMKRE